MPAPAPPRGPHLKYFLHQLGRQIRLRRKRLGLTSVATAEAAGVSRMTLNRIEGGGASVTMGAYLNVISVLGLEVHLHDPAVAPAPSTFKLPKRIRVADYPQLKQLAWQLKKNAEVTAEEALAIYERNWRHVEREKLSASERQLIEGLANKFGKGGILV